jgi:hypothetical protein
MAEETPMLLDRGLIQRTVTRVNTMKRIWFLGWLLGTAMAANAHLNSVSYSSINVEEYNVYMEFRYTLLCTLELFRIDTNNDRVLSEEEMAAGKPMIFYYLKNKIKVLSGGKQLKLVIAKMEFAEEDDDAYLICHLIFRGKKVNEPIILFCNVSEETDANHRHIAEIKLPDTQGVFIFTRENYFDSQSSPLIQEAESAVNIQTATTTIE